MSFEIITFSKEDRRKKERCSLVDTYLRGASVVGWRLLYRQYRYHFESSVVLHLSFRKLLTSHFFLHTSIALEWVFKHDSCVCLRHRNSFTSNYEMLSSWKKSHVYVETMRMKITTLTNINVSLKDLICIKTWIVTGVRLLINFQRIPKYSLK